MIQSYISVLALIVMIFSKDFSNASNLKGEDDPTIYGDDTCDRCDGTLSFDFYLLVLQWQYPFPRGATKPYFTLHGLWPNSNAGGRNFLCCCKDVEYDPNEITNDIRDDMYKYWPSNQGDNDVFWEHEWKKHGSCTPNVDEHDYFKKALDLRSYFDIASALTSFISVGGNVRRVKEADIIQAIKNKFDVDATLGCKSSRSGDYQYLDQVALCLSSRNPHKGTKGDGVPSCPDNIHRSRGNINDCDDNKDIIITFKVSDENIKASLD